MIATITHTRRPLWLRLLKPLRVWMLRADVASAEQYVEDVRACGVLNEQEIEALKSNIGPKRALLLMWERA